MRIRRFAVALVVALAGCVAPDADFVRIMRMRHDLVAPAYAEYLCADESLSPERRDRRLRGLASWDAVIRAAEAELGEAE
jgi:hypothetical protein